MRFLVLALLASLAPGLLAQQTTRRLIRAIGEASVSVQPDAARVTVSVVKQAATAAGAASENAVASAAVIGALRQLLGPAADIRTVAYHLSPLYNYPRDGTPAQITGFSASNSVQATVHDTTLAGRVVDTAISAGATRVDAVSLFLRDEDASRGQALRLAAQRARTKADSIALGLGVRLGGVLMAQEGFASSSVPLPSGRVDATAAVTPPPPIEAGTLEVRATVTLDIEITP